MKKLISSLFLLTFLALVPAGAEAFSVRPSYVDVQATETQRSISLFIENTQDVPFLVSSRVVSDDGALTEDQINEAFSLPEGDVLFEPGQIVEIPLKFQAAEGLSGNYKLQVEIIAKPQGGQDSVGLISVFAIPLTVGFGPSVEGFAGLNSADIQKISGNKIRVIGRVENTTQRRLTGFYAVELQKGDYKKTLGGENAVLKGASEKELQSEYSLFSIKDRLLKPMFGKAVIKVSYLPTYGADYQVLWQEVYLIPWLFISFAGFVILFGIMVFVRLKNAKRS